MTAPPSRAADTQAMRAELHQSLRFLAVGAWNTMFGYLVFVSIWWLDQASLEVWQALVLAYLISLPLAFLLQKHLTFRRGGDGARQLRRFALANTLLFVANLVTVPFATGLSGAPAWLVQAAFVVLATSVSYLAHSRWSFAR